MTPGCHAAFAPDGFQPGPSSLDGHLPHLPFIVLAIICTNRVCCQRKRPREQLRKSVCGHFFVLREREFLPVRIRSRSAEIRGNVLSKAKTRGSAQVAASETNRRALPSDTTRNLVFDSLTAPQTRGCFFRMVRALSLVDQCSRPCRLLMAAIRQTARPTPAIRMPTIRISSCFSPNWTPSR